MPIRVIVDHRTGYLALAGASSTTTCGGFFSVIYVLGIAGAAFLGVGWVLQQRVAARSIATKRLGWDAMRQLIRNLEWWGGIAAAAIGQTLAAFALQDGAITLVEPLMVASLFFAFAFSAALGRHRVCRHEVIVTLLLAAAVAMFLGVAHPRATASSLPALFPLLLATGGATGAALVILAASRGVRRRHAAVATATATAAAAGIFYALQDVATRGAIVAARSGGWLSVLHLAWPYIMLFGATAGVLFAQEAFRAARLDWSLPPTAAVQPLAGVALGVGVLSDHITADPLQLAIEAFSIVVGIAGVMVMGRRMRAMHHSWHGPGWWFAAGKHPAPADAVPGSRSDDEAGTRPYVIAERG